MIKAIFGSFVAMLFFSGASMAQSCAAYTYSFSNGTTADASQVNSNFSQVRNCLNTIQSGGTFGATTFTGTLTTSVGTTGAPSIIVSPAIATPGVNNGIWSDGTHIYWRDNSGGTHQLDN